MSSTTSHDAAADVVYIVGPNTAGGELRHSLRSLENVEHGDVWIVGELPAWARNVNHIPTRQTESRFRNSTANLRAACEHPDVPQLFTFWNDDFYALRPTHVPNWHRGEVTDVRRVNPNRIRRQARHADGLAATAWLLRRWGHDKILNYELHVPLVVNAELMLEALDAAAPANIEALHKRTLYGNLVELGGRKHDDVKIADHRRTFPTGAHWGSTHDGSFSRGRVGQQLREMFPTPCRYEQEGA